jgi:hypothetical protein
MTILDDPDVAAAENCACDAKPHNNPWSVSWTDQGRSALLVLGKDFVCQYIGGNIGLTSDTEIPFTCVVRKKVFGVPSQEDCEQKEEKPE